MDRCAGLEGSREVPNTTVQEVLIGALGILLFRCRRELGLHDVCALLGTSRAVACAARQFCAPLKVNFTPTSLQQMTSFVQWILRNGQLIHALDFQPNMPWVPYVLGDGLLNLGWAVAGSAVSDEREKGPEAGIILAQGMAAADALPGARPLNMRTFTCTAWHAVVPSLLTSLPTTLTGLHFCWDSAIFEYEDPTSESHDAITQPLVDALSRLPDLEELRFGSMHQHSHPISAAAFENCTRLSALEIDGVIMGPEHMQRLPPGLKAMFLSRWGFPDEAEWALDLSHLTALTELSTRCSWSSNEVVFPPNLQVLHDRVCHFKHLEPLALLRHVSNWLELPVALQLAGVATRLTYLALHIQLGDENDSDGGDEDGLAGDTLFFGSDAINGINSAGGMNESVTYLAGASCSAGMQGYIDSVVEAGFVDAVQGVWLSPIRGIVQIDSIVMLQLARLDHLQAVRLDMVDLSAEAAAQLSGLTKLTKLDLYTCFFSDDVLLQLPTVLAQLPSLHLLQLPMNMEERLMSDLAAAQREGLLRGLAAVCQLRVLELPRFEGNEGQEDVKAVLADAPHLRVKWV